MTTEVMPAASTAGWAPGLGQRLHGARVLVLAVVLLAGVLRAWGLAAKSLWFDETYTVFIARHPLAEILRLLRTYDNHPPLYYAVLHLWLGLFGKSEVAVRLPSLLASLGAVAVTYLLGRRLAGERVGILAAALLAVSPFQVTAAQEARMYPFLTLFGLGASSALWLGLEEGRRRYWIAYAMLMALALYTHYLALLLLLAHGAYVLAIDHPRAARMAWIRWTAVAAVTAVPLLPTIWTQLVTALALPAFQDPFRVRTFADLLGLFAFGGGLFGMGTYYRPGTLPLVYQIPLLLPFLLLAVGGLAGVEDRRKRAFILDYWFLPIVIVSLITIKWNVLQERYFSFVVPPFAILLAAGVVSLGRTLRGSRRVVIRGGVLLLLLVFNAAALAGAYHDQPLYDWRGAAQFVMVRAGAGDYILYIPASVGIPFEFYFHGDQDRTDLSPDVVLTIANQAAQGKLRLRTSVPPEQMAAIARTHSRMWIIASVALGSGMRRRIAEALAPSFREAGGATFGLVNASLWESRLYEGGR